MSALNEHLMENEVDGAEITIKIIVKIILEQLNVHRKKCDFQADGLLNGIFQKFQPVLKNNCR